MVASVVLLAGPSLLCSCTVDAWSQMIYNKLRSQELPTGWRSQANNGTADTLRAGVANSSVGRSVMDGSRFFAPSLETWLGTRGAALQFEQCEGGRSAKCVSSLHKLWWWPFHC